MDNKQKMADIGLLITKAPLESSLTTKFLELADNVIKNKISVGLFLISDGVLLVKNNQKNLPFNIIKKLIKNNVEVIASKDHLESAGISDNEILNGVKISEKPYDDLVNFVMERYQKVITL